MKKVEEKTFRFFEVSFCVLAISIIVLLSIVVYFVGQKPKMCIEYIDLDKQALSNTYDVNNDGKVSMTDVMIKYKEAKEIYDYYINEN